VRRRAMSSAIGFVLAIALACLPALAQAQQVPPELLAYPNLVIVNARVLTVNQQFTVAEAIAMRDGPGAGLSLVEGILERGKLQEYSLAHSVRADLLRRLGKRAEARSAYQQALALTQQEPERRFLENRLQELTDF